MAKFYISLHQVTGNVSVCRSAPKANEALVVKVFHRADYGDETLYKAQDYMDTLK